MPRRILLLITDLEIGGTPTVVRELATRLNDPPQVVVEVACLGGRGPVADQLQAAGIRVTPLGARRATDLTVVLRLARLIRTRRYDTVLSFLIHANAAATFAAPFCPGVRFLQSIQTTQPRPRWHWAVQSIVHYAAERVIVPSPSVASAAEDWADIPPGKIAIIPNAIDPADFNCAAGASPTQDIPVGPIPIGFIGRLDPIKRIADLVQAVKRLNTHVHLHVFGEGGERPHIESLIGQLNLSSFVTLHGAVARPQEALRQISLLVLPSAAEGFGLVLIEAMAAGVPVVATNVSGIRDVVRNGQTGLLVPPFSPAALAGAIEKVLGDEGLRRHLIATAREEVRTRFTWDAVLPRYRAILGLA